VPLPSTPSFNGRGLVAGLGLVSQRPVAACPRPSPAAPELSINAETIVPLRGDRLRPVSTIQWLDVSKAEAPLDRACAESLKIIPLIRDYRMLEFKMTQRLAEFALIY
jgi:hypothetical protein